MAAITCAGAVLIGGKSTRMGTPKHELHISEHRTMADCVIDALRTICERVITVNSHGDETDSDRNVIRDLRPDAGPLGGIEALLASGIAEHYLVCPCDLPLVTPELLRMLLAQPDALASVFQIEGSEAIEPLPARFRADVLPIVRRLLNRRKRAVWKLLQEVQPHVVTLPPHAALQLQNVNTPEAFSRAMERMRG